MKLIVKMPAGKPPFMGILLGRGDNRSYPEKLNEDLLTEHKYADYKIILEFINDKLNLQLVSEKSRIKRQYNDLQYDGVELLGWTHCMKDEGIEEFKFGHVIVEDNKETVVKTWGKKERFVLSIKKYELYTFKRD